MAGTVEIGNPSTADSDMYQTVSMDEFAPMARRRKSCYPAPTFVNKFQPIEILTG